MDVKISVIIPVYNTAKFLPQCLDSIASQTLKDIEVICVDDGSTDDSLSVLKEYAKKDSRFSVYAQPNTNAGAARNRGIEHASGKYYSFLDSDDFFEEDMLEKAYELAEKQKTEIVLFRSDEFLNDKGIFQPADKTVKEKMLPKKEVFSGEEVNTNLFKAIKGWAWDKLFLKEFADRNKLLFQEQRTTNDMYYVYAALAKAERITLLDEIFVHHRMNNRSSLENTRELSWRCGHDALLLLKKQLIEWKLYPHYEKAFVNYSTNYLLWSLYTLKVPVKEYFFNAMKEEWLGELDIANHEKSFFDDREEYEMVQNIINCDFKGYCTAEENMLSKRHIFRELSEKIDRFTDSIRRKGFKASMARFMSKEDK